MGQSGEPQELIRAGPFAGINYTDADLYVKPGYAVQAINCNTKIIPGALVPERGRKQCFDANALGIGHIDSIEILYPCMGNGNHPYVLCQGLNGATLVTFLYDELAGTANVVVNASKFTQAVQFLGVVYTNGGQRFFLNADKTKFYQWQYGPDPFAENIAIFYSRAQANVRLHGAFNVPETFTITIDGNAIVYTSTLTVGGSTIAPDTNIDNLIRNIANNVNIYYASGPGAGFVNKINAQVAPFPTPGDAVVILTSVFTGLTGNARTLAASTSSSTATFIASGPTFTNSFVDPGPGGGLGNIEQNNYQYVFTQQTIMPDGTVSETSVFPDNLIFPINITIGVGNNNAIKFAQRSLPIVYKFTGTNSDGTTYTTNIYRRSFPVGTNATGSVNFQLVANVATNAGYEDKLSDAEIASHPFLVDHRDPPPAFFGAFPNRGFICIWRSRIWFFAVVDNADTLNQPQTQLWYSGIGRGWEFDNVDRVLLVDADMTVVPEVTGPNYDDVYGNYPKGLAVVGSYLGVWKHRETWQAWGDGSTSNPFVCKQVLTIGAASSASILPANGGVFWLSESGDAYFWTGTEPQYTSQTISNVVKLTPLNAGISPADLAQATFAYAQRVAYLCFPAMGVSYGYDMTSGDWTSQLPYSPHAARAVFSTPSSPTTTTAKQFNEVLAARNGAPAIVDWWFADPNNDLGVPQIFSWRTPLTDSGKSGWMKWPTTAQVISPKQQGQVQVQVILDDGDDVVTQSFRLDQGYRSKVKMLTGAHQGYVTAMKITVQGLPNQPAPVIWAVILYGTVTRFLEKDEPET